MSHYHRLLSTAVAGLADNTVDARRHLYDRAHGAFLAGLANCEPPLSDAEVAYERTAFEQAVRTVEAETTGRTNRDTTSKEQAHRTVHSNVADRTVVAPPPRNAVSRRWPLDWLSGVVSKPQSLVARVTRSLGR